MTEPGRGFSRPGKPRRGADIQHDVTEWAAELLVVVAGAYVAAGLVFALAFVMWGVSRVDPAARGATRGFRLIILPGAAAFWPLLAARWAAGSMHPPTETNAHRRAASRPRDLEALS